MSANTIARWNAIPLERTEPRLVKRSRSPPSDDDVSLVSQTPSPPSMDIDKYDEYVKGVAREEITVDTRIKSTNKGFAMLAKLGWTEGQPLGISGDGRVDPIPFQVKRDLTGLGKYSQDVRMIETTVSQRRGLDSERQQRETEEQRQAREESVARRSAIASEVSSTLKAFYCTLCEKQFQNVAQYDEHTNSYAHHHKARFKDMQASQRALASSKEEGEKRKEKERKREEKELRKIAKAAGVKMSKPPVVLDPVTVKMEQDSKSSGFNTIGRAMSSDPPSSVPGQKSGWATVGSAAMSTLKAKPPNPQLSKETLPSSPSISASTHTCPVSAPAFRTAGWTSLDTGSSQPLPSPPAVPPPSLPSTQSHQPTPSHWSNASHIRTDISPMPPDRTALSTGPDLPLPKVEPGLQGRSGWQQFLKSAPKR